MNQFGSAVEIDTPVNLICIFNVWKLNFPPKNNVQKHNNFKDRSFKFLLLHGVIWFQSWNRHPVILIIFEVLDEKPMNLSKNDKTALSSFKSCTNSKMIFFMVGSDCWEISSLKRRLKHETLKEWLKIWNLET